MIVSTAGLIRNIPLLCELCEEGNALDLTKRRFSLGCSGRFDSEVGDQGQVIGGDDRFTFSVQLQPLQRKDGIKVDVVQVQKQQHAWIRSRPLQVMTDIRPLQM